MTNEIADVLDKAAEVIERNGWTQGAYWLGRVTDPACSVCVLGAVSMAASGQPDFDEALRWSSRSAEAAQAAAKVVGFESYVDLPTWNDSDKRTKAEIIAALRNAAAAERAS